MPDKDNIFISKHCQRWYVYIFKVKLFSPEDSPEDTFSQQNLSGFSQKEPQCSLVFRFSLEFRVQAVRAFPTFANKFFFFSIRSVSNVEGGGRRRGRVV